MKNKLLEEQTSLAKRFQTKRDFLMAMDVVERFDREATAKLGGYTFVTTDGTKYRSHSFRHWLQDMNQVFGTTFNEHRSIVLMGGYNIYLKSPFPEEILSKETPEEIVEDVKEMEPFLVVEDFEGEDTSEEDEVVEEQPLSKEELFPEVDWEMINSLQNKKHDKIKLDDYAKESFSIDLNRRNTLDNMVKDFVDQLTSREE